METKYTLEYFIDKFSAIPEDLWCEGDYEKENKHCALGHCGETMNEPTKESSALKDVLNPDKRKGYISVSALNDGCNEYIMGFGTTPKERVINYLKSLRDGVSKD